ncbi:MAG: transcription-repair coupling factor [Candidatus Kapabacteria bacterium]|nr:transcription-repair coupling factor [Candidatus Kapabacteria bacterium]
MRHIITGYDPILQAATSSACVLDCARQLTEHHFVSVKTLTGSARSLLIGALWQMGSVSAIVIVADDTDVDQYVHDFSVLLGADQVVGIHGAQRQSALAAGGMVHHEQMDALGSVHEGQRFIIVCSAAALGLRAPVAGDVRSSTLTIERGQRLAYEETITSLLVSGFERTDYVSKPGQIAIRGGIVDVFPSGWESPLRFEFWGDAVESIREFEPLSQRSIREHSQVTFLAKIYHQDDAALEASILEHIPSDSLLVIDSPEAVDAELHNRDLEYQRSQLASWTTRLLLNPLGETEMRVKCQPQPSMGASVEQLLRSSAAQQVRSLTPYVGADGQQNVRRLRELCESIVDQVESDDPSSGDLLVGALNGVTWISSALSAGFIWEDIGVACFTEHQVFGRQRAQRRPKRTESGFSVRDLQQMQIGDILVHEDKGLGKYLGLHTIVINGSSQECVKLEFSGGDHLYVHLNYVHKLSKYASEEGAVPKLSKLGSVEWERKKARAKKRIKDIARDLIKLYAARKSQAGFAYPVDSIWQNEFEASFQYEDTPDQARATAEVKFDMESPTPMDRLVCGDVGFGKTEVAVRAAFKAAQSGKQVAVLVPTTILAEQHGVTFRDRLRRYPVRIEVLSRFRSRQEQKEILQRISDGSVDIVVGTHRLLSKDVLFKELGLLIIDEEHRFGVAAKEKLRQLRTTVDTLTLTATPIPRTLNFSLMGARDLSVIETPPRNRLPVRTEIVEWNDDIMREALLRELERGGQCFVVTDRIKDIDKLSMKIKMLVPALRVAVAHGQMEAEVLEDVMEGFLERKYDVLIATKIIESGLDIPNANTMIIENSDNFGLAELYQLRGRVGRSNTQAYCYLLIPPPHTLSRMALRRLQALEEYTDLGSGFKLAMRDLEIRGAGNLLGGEQSGFILEMGFELYQKILEEAVLELRHDEFQELFPDDSARRRSFANNDVAVELDTDALIPHSFIPADTDRYDVYRRLYNATEQRQVDVVYDELRDRFGALPPEAEELLYAVRLRIAAIPTGFVRVAVRGERMIVELPAEENTAWYDEVFQRLMTPLAEFSNARLVQHGKRLVIEVILSDRHEAQFVLDRFASVVRSIGSVHAEDLE